jgi:hypothetical protein
MVIPAASRDTLYVAASNHCFTRLIFAAVSRRMVLPAASRQMFHLAALQGGVTVNGINEQA